MAFIEPNSINILNETIQNNVFIPINKRPIKVRTDLFDKGIRHIRDLVDAGKIMTLEMFQAKHGVKVGHMFYNSLISAIPAKWRLHIKLGTACTSTDTVSNEVLLNENIDFLVKA